jgi:DUF1365 family protein
LDGSRRRLRYTFDKTFHVSPFLSLDQRYDWLFSQPDDTLLVQSQNVTRGNGGSGGGCECMFTAQLRMRRVEPSRVTPWYMAWVVLVAFPLLTWRLQWWIHYEAFLLWWKGAVFYPHPTGATNAFTRAVVTVMTPLAMLASAFTGGSAAAAPAGDNKEQGPAAAVSGGRHAQRRTSA